MLQPLLIVLGLYLAACYGYGMYLAIRLFTGRRLRQTAMGTPPRRIVRPLGQAKPMSPSDVEALAAQEEETRAAA